MSDIYTRGLPSYNAEVIHARLLDLGIPERMVGSLVRYIQEGQAPLGRFLTAVLCNDLAESCVRADPDNKKLLREYVMFLHNYAPRGSHGSRENFKEWCKTGGLKGRLTEKECANF